MTPDIPKKRTCSKEKDNKLEKLANINDRFTFPCTSQVASFLKKKA